MKSPPVEGAECCRVSGLVCVSLVAQGIVHESDHVGEGGRVFSGVRDVVAVQLLFEFIKTLLAGTL